MSGDLQQTAVDVGLVSEELVCVLLQRVVVVVGLLFDLLQVLLGIVELADDCQSGPIWG